MCSFLSCPSDVSLIVWFLVISAIIAYLIFIRSKNKFLSLTFFSCFSNGAFFLTAISGSLIFRIYNVEWLQYFSLFIWPLANVLLIIKSFRKYEKAQGVLEIVFFLKPKYGFNRTRGLSSKYRCHSWPRNIFYSFCLDEKK